MADESVAPETKTCTKCGETKPIEAFKICKAKNGTTYRRNRCRTCKAQPRPSIPDPLTHKMCTICGETKQIEDFSPDPHAYDGYRNQCRRCREDVRRPGLIRRREAINAKRRATYAANPEPRKEVERLRRITNGDLIRAQQKARRTADPEKVRAQMRARHAANPEKNRAKDRERRAKDPEKFRARARARRAANPEKANEKNREWRQHNPEHARLLGAKKRARKRSLPSTFTKAEQQFCRQYFHYACAACTREEGFEWTISMDHWIPLNSHVCPGTVATNMIPLCNGIGGCNTSKQHRDPGAWLLRRFGKRKAAAILRRIEAYFALVRAQQSGIKAPEDVL